MKYPTLVRTAILAMALAAPGGVTVRADVIKLDVSATLVPLTGNCSPTCTLGGDIVIDNSSGAANNGFVSAEVTASEFSPSVGPFIHFGGIMPSGGLTELTINDSNSGLTLAFTTPTAGSLVGYTGGALSSDTALGANPEFIWSLSSGSLTQAVVPAPLIGRGLPTVLALSGVLFGAKLLRRRNRGPLAA